MAADPGSATHAEAELDMLAEVCSHDRTVECCVDCCNECRAEADKRSNGKPLDPWLVLAILLSKGSMHVSDDDLEMGRALAKAGGRIHFDYAVGGWRVWVDQPKP